VARKHTTEEQLSRVSLFSRLTKGQLNRLASLVTTIDVPAGRVLAHEGAPGNEFIIIIDGEADIVRGETTITGRGPGDFFGEISLLLDRPRTASVVARTPMTIDVIDRRAFKGFLSDNPELYEPLLEALAERIVLATDLAND
jgi:CRP/FNR family cyclic AMP-dependent transcriptional regulator